MSRALQHHYKAGGDGANCSAKKLLKQSVIAWLAAASTASAAAVSFSPVHRPWCPVTAPANIYEINAKVEAARAADKHGLALRNNEEIHVNVYFHVIAKGPKEADGYVPKAKITEVMEILNGAYAPTPFRFTLLDTDWTINSSWHADYELEANDYAFKSVLRKGKYSDLNVYSIYDWSGGYAVLPDDASQKKDAFIHDGVVLGPDAFNGSSNVFYDQGKTLAHETGHWLGLLHTFQGDSCYGDGDFIDDTPFELPIYKNQKFMNEGCPAKLDSYPDQPGYDPIDNYMDYSLDECKNRFTPNQITRMINHWKTFRASGKSPVCSAGDDSDD